MKKIRLIPVLPKESKQLRVAVYCRVSTRSKEQKARLFRQIWTYMNQILNHPDWEFAGIFYDFGKSGLQKRGRTGLEKILKQAETGEVDYILTKSVSRVSRDTMEILNIVRYLKERGISMYFENERLDSMNPEAEAYITLACAVAQEESRNMSENMQWTVRRNFEQGIFTNYKAFMGYRCVNGELKIVPEQAEIVKQIFDLYLAGNTFAQIKRELERQRIKTATGKENWDVTTIQKMLKNEKYKGDTLLQKSYTVDFLTKKRVQNDGEIQQYYIEDDHEAIIEPWIWECVQLEMKRRERYLEEHNITRFSQNTEANPFSSKIICGECNRAFTRKGWRTPSGDRKVWQCSERYKVKGVLGCGNRHIYEETLIEIYLMAWNRLLECREMLVPEWERKTQGEDLLAKFRAKDFMEITKDAQPIKGLDIDLMLRTVDYIKVYESGMVVTVFLDGTEIEWIN